MGLTDDGPEFAHESLPNVKPGCALAIRPQKDMRVNLMARRLPFCFIGAAVPIKDSKHTLTVAAGAVKRVLGEVPEPDPRFVRQFRSFVRRWLRTNMSPLPPETDVSVPTWLKNSNYDMKRQNELTRADAEYRGDLDRDSFLVKLFSKVEGLDGYKRNRLINARVDYAKVVFGPYVAAVEHELFGRKEFIKTVPVRDRPKVIAETLLPLGGNLVVTDYSSYEGCFTPQVMRACECQLYSYMMRNLRHGLRVADLLKSKLTGRQRCESKLLSYSVDGTRMSGDMVTSLGNSFTNLMMMRFVCHQLRSRTDGFVEGDDGIFSVVGRVPSPTLFSRLGFNIKMKLVGSLAEAEFCGLIFDGVAQEVVLDPCYALSRIGWTTSDQRFGGRNLMCGLQRAKAFSLLYEAPGSPITSALGQALLRVTSGYKATRETIGGKTDWWDDQVVQSSSLIKLDPLVQTIVDRGPLLASRLLCERKFGISVSAQLTIEARIKELTLGDFASGVILDLCGRHAREYYRNHRLTLGAGLPWEYAHSYEHVRMGTNLRKFKRFTSEQTRNDPALVARWLVQALRRV